MTSYPVKVSNIASTTTDEQLNDFFAFCGSIKKIEREKDPSTATIRFEKLSAARTALMLNGGNLDNASLSVTSDVVKEDDHLQQATTSEETGGDHIDQADKPRAAIAAEYLAKGYSLSDRILQRAIDIDQKQGISKSCLTYFNGLNSRLGERAFGAEQTVTGTVQAKVEEQIKQAKAIDEQKGISKTAHDYYEKAIASPLGQRVMAFYTESTKQVHDIHEEARRMAQEEKRKASTSEESAPASTAPEKPEKSPVA
ncbi:hypothetical protein Agabi119p4_3002 [Agaricus bisporus var. burnettii]|uniref:RRM domain-containing protein n=1 Tax=Agaricus bisporus var. burnettii TaxID=192524 RepID=A0A8H7KIR7_AGABI|nr:hypothetical protein Agabi119p4_3002 [Agaricus bisporus var. burnettii]